MINMMISHVYTNIDRNSHGFDGKTKRDTYFFSSTRRREMRRIATTTKFSCVRYTGRKRNTC